jgi:uncharacterized protein
MRRNDKEILDRASIDEIIIRAEVCRLGLCVDNKPYVVPVSHGYDGNNIYFHTAQEGKAIDYISINSQVCFEFEHDVHIQMNDTRACGWTHSFYSVIGFGIVNELTDANRKIYALNRVMEHYSGKEWDFEVDMLAKIRTWCISIDQITGKQSLDKLPISRSQKIGTV